MQHNGFEYIDLNLPSGNLWATCNVGADKPTEAGLYFQWGDTMGYTVNDVQNKVKRFIKDDYRFNYRDTFTLYTKYTNPSEKETLDEEDDGVNFYMGGKWRIPTIEDFIELKMHCEIFCEDVAEDDGRIVKANKLKSDTRCDESLVFPITTTFVNSLPDGFGSTSTLLWTRSNRTSRYATGVNISFRTKIILGGFSRFRGMNLRGVVSKNDL